MGSALGSLFSSAGARVQHITSSTPAGNVEGEIVVLAVPYPAITDVFSSYGDQLAGKVVVDISNPVDFVTFQLAVPSDSSATAEIAAALPTSKVLKAFNTNFAATLATKNIGNTITTTVLIAGDDDDAKTALGELVTAAGVQSIDVGALTSARELEALGYLQLQLGISQKLGFAGGFAVIR